MMDLIIPDEVVIEALLKDAKRFKSKWELRTSEPTRLKPNTNFLQRTLSNVVRLNQDRMLKKPTIQDFKIQQLKSSQKEPSDYKKKFNSNESPSERKRDSDRKSDKISKRKERKKSSDSKRKSKEEKRKSRSSSRSSKSKK